MATTLETLLELDGTDSEPRYSVAQYPGIAFYFHSAETEWSEMEWSYPDIDPDTGEEVETYYYDLEETYTGRALMVMVGDDTRHSIDPSDITPIADTDYCSECGQIGCTAYATEEG